MTQIPTIPVLKFSKVDYCPSCQRKLCKRVTRRDMPLVEFRHKGASVYGSELSIGCLGCQKEYIVTATDGIIDEVTSGR